MQTYRVARWLGLGIAALVGLLLLAVVGFYLAVEISRLPHDFRSTWLDGPGDARIRCVSWTEGGSWMDDPYEVHEYTLVASDGTETLIGQGPAPLDADRVRLYQHGEQAELVVEDVAFRRTPRGRWPRFWAKDRDFIYRHYAPFTDRSVKGTAASWQATYTGLPCTIADVDLRTQRLLSACGYDRPKVQLVFTRATPDAPWKMDPEATFAQSPPPQREAFPEAVRASLTMLRVEPRLPLRRLPQAYQLLETARKEPGVTVASELEHVIGAGRTTDLTMITPAFTSRWQVEGGWLDASGSPVVFWPDWKMIAHPWGQATLVHHGVAGSDNASYLLYVTLHRDAPPRHGSTSSSKTS